MLRSVCVLKKKAKGFPLLSGLGHRFPKEAFRLKGAVKMLENHIKRCGKAKNPTKLRKQNRCKTRKPQLNREKTHKHSRKFKV